MKILMSRHTPTGRKLEDVLQDLIDDINEKSSMIKESEHDEKNFIIDGNNDIVSLLHKAKLIQESSMTYLKTRLGPNKGPQNPRL